VVIGSPGRVVELVGPDVVRQVGGIDFTQAKCVLVVGAPPVPVTVLRHSARYGPLRSDGGPLLRQPAVLESGMVNEIRIVAHAAAGIVAGVDAGKVPGYDRQHIGLEPRRLDLPQRTRDPLEVALTAKVVMIAVLGRIGQAGLSDLVTAPAVSGAVGLDTAGVIP